MRALKIGPKWAGNMLSLSGTVRQETRQIEKKVVQEEQLHKRRSTEMITYFKPSRTAKTTSSNCDSRSSFFRSCAWGNGPQCWCSCRGLLFPFSKQEQTVVDFHQTRKRRALRNQHSISRKSRARAHGRSTSVSSRKKSNISARAGEWVEYR